MTVDKSGNLVIETNGLSFEDIEYLKLRTLETIERMTQHKKEAWENYAILGYVALYLDLELQTGFVVTEGKYKVPEKVRSKYSEIVAYINTVAFVSYLFFKRQFDLKLFDNTVLRIGQKSGRELNRDFILNRIYAKLN